MKKHRPSEFYRLRFKLGLDVDAAAQLCGVTPRTIKNWDKKGAPCTAMRLLLLWDRKHVCHDGWEGFLFSRGALVCGRLRFRPETLRHYPALIDRLRRVEAEQRQLLTWCGWLRHGLKLANLLN